MSLTEGARGGLCICPLPGTSSRAFPPRCRSSNNRRARISAQSEWGYDPVIGRQSGSTRSMRGKGKENAPPPPLSRSTKRPSQLIISPPQLIRSPPQRNSASRGAVPCLGRQAASPFSPCSRDVGHMKLVVVLHHRGKVPCSSIGVSESTAAVPSAEVCVCVGWLLADRAVRHEGPTVQLSRSVIWRGGFGRDGALGRQGSASRHFTGSGTPRTDFKRNPALCTIE